MSTMLRKALNFMLLFACLAALGMSQSVNVCSAEFNCTNDVDCQNVGNRFGEKWACKTSRCVTVECLIDLDCTSLSVTSTSTLSKICVQNNCRMPQIVPVGSACDVTAGCALSLN